MLRVEQLIKHFGGVKAVDGVSFDVLPGQCSLGARRGANVSSRASL